MPIIQRNLFPSKPPSKKNDGPSVLRAANSNSNNNGNNTIMNPNLSLYATAKNFNKKNDLYKKDAKKLKKSQSASMISLLAINNNNNNGGRKTSNNNNNGNNKINYDSQDSFNSSDASSSDPNSLCSSSSSVDNNMISRRRILSRSRDALNSTSDDYASSTGFNNPAQDEDVWLNKAKLISDHVDEIVTKWDQIDDEIWAKVICMERNRRVAKAYARTPILTVNGLDTGFDGHRIGLNGFHNPMRDKKTIDLKKKIEDGIKIRMDEDGSLLVKRLSDTDVYVISFDKMDNMISEKIDPRKSIILFDMKQYHNELLRELKSSSPNPRVLEKRCFCFIAFATVADELLNTPIWCIVINLVALEMLVKLMPNKWSNEDNFYSLPINMSSNIKSSGYYSLSPPKLPPRDLHNKKPPLTLPEPDYEDSDEPHVIMPKPSLDDDPYYYGLSAHVPNFAHPAQHQQVIRNHQPVRGMVNAPIYRKAMNMNMHMNMNMKKPIWNPAAATLLPPNANYFRPFTYSSTNTIYDAGHYRATNFSAYCTTNRNMGSSQFDPISLLPSLRTQPIPINGIMDPSKQQANNNNDNNEIYGVTPLLRKNTAFHLRSSSSPSLKNIFSRKKNKDKDCNNNPRKH